MSFSKERNHSTSRLASKGESSDCFIRQAGQIYEPSIDDQGGPSDDQGGPSDDQAGPSDDQAGPSDDQDGPSDDQGGPSDDQGGPSDVPDPVMLPDLVCGGDGGWADQSRVGEHPCTNYIFYCSLPPHHDPESQRLTHPVYHSLGAQSGLYPLPMPGLAWSTHPCCTGSWEMEGAEHCDMTSGELYDAMASICPDSLDDVGRGIVLQPDNMADIISHNHMDINQSVMCSMNGRGQVLLLNSCNPGQMVQSLTPAAGQMVQSLTPAAGQMVQSLTPAAGQMVQSLTPAAGQMVQSLTPAAGQMVQSLTPAAGQMVQSLTPAAGPFRGPPEQHFSLGEGEKCFGDENIDMGVPVSSGLLGAAVLEQASTPGVPSYLGFQPSPAGTHTLLPHGQVCPAYSYGHRPGHSYSQCHQALCSLYSEVQSLPSQIVAPDPPNIELTWDSKSKKPCNCTKSQCLKLYCDCFANGDVCSSCNCINCFNNADHESERYKAIKICLDRNPEAFRPKIVQGKSGEVKGRHNKGCNCKRSGCLKNYCECYEAKIMCSSTCKCVGCRNYEDSPVTRTIVWESPDSTFYRKANCQKKKCPLSCITLDVVEATCGCLLAQAEKAERKLYSAPQAERIIIEGFGKCLMQIVRSIFKSTVL